MHDQKQSTRTLAWQPGHTPSASPFADEAQQFETEDEGSTCPLASEHGPWTHGGGQDEEGSDSEVSNRYSKARSQRSPGDLQCHAFLAAETPVDCTVDCREIVLRSCGVSCLENTASKTAAAVPWLSRRQSWSGAGHCQRAPQPTHRPACQACSP